ncbi:hypothetical protein V1264_024080 [Littorina saxatilis]|uniref:Mucolipin extracytosolic domain-containing protein n=1 Tax=Littorina saxatilis TaxID=31220 RepID=A0AAN9B9N1_9CAEN
MASANIWLKLNTPGPRKKQSNHDSQPNPRHNHPHHDSQPNPSHNHPHHDSQPNPRHNHPHHDSQPNPRHNHPHHDSQPNPRHNHPHHDSQPNPRHNHPHHDSQPNPRHNHPHHDSQPNPRHNHPHHDSQPNPRHNHPHHDSQPNPRHNHPHHDSQPNPRHNHPHHDSQPNPRHNYPHQPLTLDVRSQGVRVEFDNHGFDICDDNDKDSRHDLPPHDLDRPKDEQTKGSEKVLSNKRHSGREDATSHAVGRSEDEQVKEELSVADHDGSERQDNESEEAATSPSQRGKEEDVASGSEPGVSNSENPDRRGKEVTFTIQDLDRPGGRGDDTTRVGREENENETTDKLRRDVTLFFMDPFSKIKFKVKKRCCIYCPVKLIVQILKICFISGQMVQFGKQRSEMVEFIARTDTALKHLVLKDWSATYETMTYPPATGPFAVYTVDDLLDSIQYTWEKYYSLPATSLATISLLPDSSSGQPLPLRLCNRFVNYEQFPNGTYVVRSGEESYCTDLVPLEGQVNYDIRAFLRQRNLNLTYSKLLDITLTFPFNTFHFNLMETQTGPTCFTVNVTVLFSNYKRSGQILISLRILTEERTCTGRIMSQDVEELVESVRAGSLVLNIIVILVCLLSSCLCGRSLHRARILKQKVEKQYKKLQMSDCMQFVNLWYVLMIVGDACIIAGSIFKSLLEFRAISSSSSNSNACGMLLGLGGLMAWVGSLRYLDFFKGFSVSSRCCWC